MWTSSLILIAEDPNPANIDPLIILVFLLVVFFDFITEFFDEFLLLLEHDIFFFFVLYLDFLFYFYFTVFWFSLFIFYKFLSEQYVLTFVNFGFIWIDLQKTVAMKFYILEMYYSLKEISTHSKVFMTSSRR